MRNFWKSKTFWSAVLGAAGYLLSQDAISATEIMTALGAVGAALGLRDAAAKSK